MQYKTAQICIRGHIITGDCDNYSNKMSPYCSNCSMETISACPSCNSDIRGDYCDDTHTSLRVPLKIAPLYCHNCGKPYPWTEFAITSMQKIIDEESNLSDDDKKKLVQSLPDLIAESPGTNLAVSRVKRAAQIAGDITQKSLMQFISSFACQAVKTLLNVP